MGNAIQPLLGSVADALQAIVLTMHNEDFSRWVCTQQYRHVHCHAGNLCVCVLVCDTDSKLIYANAYICYVIYNDLFLCVLKMHLYTWTSIMAVCADYGVTF